MTSSQLLRERLSSLPIVNAPLRMTLKKSIDDGSLFAIHHAADNIYHAFIGSCAAQPATLDLRALGAWTAIFQHLEVTLENVTCRVERVRAVYDVAVPAAARFAPGGEFREWRVPEAYAPLAVSTRVSVCVTWGEDAFAIMHAADGERQQPMLNFRHNLRRGAARHETAAAIHVADGVLHWAHVPRSLLTERRARVAETVFCSGRAAPAGFVEGDDDVIAENVRWCSLALNKLMGV